MTIGVVGNSTKQSLPEAVDSLLKLGATFDLKFFLHDDLQKVLKKKLGGVVSKKQYLSAKELVRNCDLIVAFGGDGTILSAARMVGKAQTPILGINLGKLGFLAEVSIDELESFIHDILNRHHIVEERSVLKIHLEKEKAELVALNEVVIDKSSSSRVIHISVYVNDDYLVSYQGDGIIISTPTGSTGYALAAGGPIVAPTTDVLVIQPISPHSLSARTVIVPDSSTVRIVVGHLSDRARVTADGQFERGFTPPSNIYIQKADYSVKLVKRKDRSYYDVLRAKLFWGSDIRLIKGKEEK
ncbi:MAG: NAD(+)/NADH kinase [Ignavibacteriales bacterium]|nr:NAD(+)/NADH kinase [Ignavibacteriales bacterium]